MEVFIECMVKRQKTTKDALFQSLIVFGAVVLSIVVFIIGTFNQIVAFTGIFIVVGLVYGAWYLMRSFNLEFEYILTNGELDVDKIVAQSKRKRLVTFDFKNIEMMAPLKECYRGEYEQTSITKKIDASIGTGEGTYFVRFPGKEGMTVLFFNPDDRIISGARQFAPRKVFTE
jgi:hypothetical protein